MQASTSVHCFQGAIEELTGSVKAEHRSLVWNLPHKTVFFATPQTFKNDVCKGAMPPTLYT